MQRRRVFPKEYHEEMQEAWAHPRQPWADAFNWALQLKLIQRHGCPANLRSRVWPFLLGLDMSSWEDAESLYTKLRQLAASTEAAHAFCLSQGAPEEYYTGVQRMLDVDVPRAPRNCPFLQGDARPQGLARLRAVLEALCLIEPELGYWQGYADIAAPFLNVFGQDHQAFWALRQLLAVRLRHAFATPLPPPRPKPPPPPPAQAATGSTGGLSSPPASSSPSYSASRPSATSALDVLWSEIEKVSNILSHADPKLHSHLSNLSTPFGQSPTQCSFQMIHIYFSRELPLDQLQVFWEAMWASEEELRLSTSLSNGNTGMAPSNHTPCDHPPPSCTDSTRQRSSSSSSSRCELEAVPEPRGSGHGAGYSNGGLGVAYDGARISRENVQNNRVESILHAGPSPISSPDPSAAHHPPCTSHDPQGGDKSSSRGSSVQCSHAEYSGNVHAHVVGAESSTHLAHGIEPMPLFSPPTPSDTPPPHYHNYAQPHGHMSSNNGTLGAEESWLIPGSMNHTQTQGVSDGAGDVCDGHSSHRTMGSGRQSLAASEEASQPDVKMSRGRGGSSGRYRLTGQDIWADQLNSGSRRKGREELEMEDEGQGMPGQLGGGSKHISHTVEGLGVQENGSYVMGSVAAPRKAISGGDAYHSKKWARSNNGAEMGDVLEGNQGAGGPDSGEDVGHPHRNGVGYFWGRSMPHAGRISEGEDESVGPMGGSVGASGVRGERLNASSSGVGDMMEEAEGGVRSGRSGKRMMLSSLEENVLEEPERDDGCGASTSRNCESMESRGSVSGEHSEGGDGAWGRNFDGKTRDGGIGGGAQRLRSAVFQDPESAASQGLKSSQKKEVVLEEPDEDDDAHHRSPFNGAVDAALSASLRGRQGREHVSSAPNGGWRSEGAGPLFGGSSCSSGSSPRGMAVAEGLEWSILQQHSSKKGIQGARASVGLCSSSRAVPVAEGVIPQQHGRWGVHGSGASAGVCSSSSSSRAVPVAEGVIPQRQSGEWGVQGEGQSAGACSSSSKAVPSAEGMNPQRQGGEWGVQCVGECATVCSSSSSKAVPVAEGVISQQHSREMQGVGESAGVFSSSRRSSSSSSRAVPVAEGSTTAVSAVLVVEGATPPVNPLPESGTGITTSAPAARMPGPPWNASLSLRPYGAAALLCAHRQTLLSCTQLEHVVQFCNALPPLPSSPVALASHARQLWHMQHLEADGKAKATPQGPSKDEASVLITKSTGVPGSKAAAPGPQQQGKHAALSRKPRPPLHKRLLKAFTPSKSKSTNSRNFPQEGSATVATSGSSNDSGRPVQGGDERQGREGVEGRVGSFPGASTTGSKHGADHSPRYAFFSRCGCVNASPLSFSQQGPPNL